MDQEVVDQCKISAVHPDILHAQILTRLDGPSLASVGTASCQFHNLSNDDSLWQDICHRAWPSTAKLRLRHLITSFPSGHRSFYADSCSPLQHHQLSATIRPRHRWSPTLISAVDIHYKNKYHLFSKVQETDTTPGSWPGSQFHIELLASGESLLIPGNLNIRHLRCESELENNLSLSWILIDPTQTRAANLSSIKPVSVDRNWSTGDIEVRFGTVLSGVRKGELVECGVVVTCGECDKEALHVKQVRLEIEDVEGNHLGRIESLVILQEAMENGKRRIGRATRGYTDFTEMRRERKESKLRRERQKEEVGIYTGAVVVVGFWLFLTFRFFQLLCSYFFRFDDGKFV